MDQTRFSGNYGFVPFVQSPGIALIIIGDEKGTAAKLLLKSLAFCFPILFLSVALLWVSSLVMWFVVSMYINEAILLLNSLNKCDERTGGSVGWASGCHAGGPKVFFSDLTAVRFIRWGWERKNQVTCWVLQIANTFPPLQTKHHLSQSITLMLHSDILLKREVAISRLSVCRDGTNENAWGWKKKASLDFPKRPPQFRSLLLPTNRASGTG